jgi:hypothetical protein
MAGLREKEWSFSFFTFWPQMILALFSLIPILILCLDARFAVIRNWVLKRFDVEHVSSSISD